MTYKDLCNEEHSVVSLSPVMKQGDIKMRTEVNGTNWVLLGRQCIISAYSYWAEYLRKEIGLAMGVLDSGLYKKKRSPRGTKSVCGRRFLGRHSPF